MLISRSAAGGSLQPHLEHAWRCGRPPVQAPLALFCLAMQVAGGVAGVNRAEIAHRDLAPHNVLLARKLETLDDVSVGDVKVADFGASALCIGAPFEQRRSTTYVCMLPAGPP